MQTYQPYYFDRSIDRTMYCAPVAAYDEMHAIKKANRSLLNNLHPDVHAAIKINVQNYTRGDLYLFNGKICRKPV